MREIKITRKRKRFIGRLLKYYCVLNFSVEKFKDYVELEEKYILSNPSAIIPISNGKTITININDEKNQMYIVAFTSTGTVFSNLIVISKNYKNKSYFIQTNYNLAEGTSLLLQEEQL